VSESTASHRTEADARAAVGCAIITVSDTRTESTDESGPLIRRFIEAAGHRPVAHTLLPNDEEKVREYVRAIARRDDVDVILLSGGTGLGSRDLTVEAVRPLFDKEIPGFGELFRMLSYQEQIGTAAILTRAVAGAVHGRLVVAMPGSTAAVELALSRVLLPELRHAIRELRR
jgi:molybdenum cofactor biosynthesis protein B